MEVKITHTIEQYLYGETTSDSNSRKLKEVLIGGSQEKYETPTGFDPSVTLLNNFTIKDVQTFEFALDPTNTFNKDILTLLNTPNSEITFINAFCVETTGNGVVVPIRFQVAAELNSSGNLDVWGVMSSLNITNFSTNNFTKLFINNVVVPADKEALLIITIGSSNDNA